MAVETDEEMPAEMGRAQRIALGMLQGIAFAYAGYRLYRINLEEVGFNAIGWSIPWIAVVPVAILLFPFVVRRGWRRFGRPGPAWTIATIVSTMTWIVVTMLCWMVLGTIVILSD